MQSIDYHLKKPNNPMHVYDLIQNTTKVPSISKQKLPVNVYNNPPVRVSYNRTFVSLAVEAKYRSLFDIASARMRPLIEHLQ